MSQLFLEATHIKKAYGARTILDIERLELYEGDRVGLVGANGAGKTTLLKLLAGRIEPDEGLIRRLCAISTISQQHDEHEALRGQEASLDLAPEFRAPQERAGLSGGEQTRRRIADALSRNPHLLLADEPTTDLDAQGIGLLTARLRALPGALVLISHDRALLDAVCTRIWALEAAKITAYVGNYSAYRAEEARRRAFMRFEYDQYRAEQVRLRGAIQGKREHASQVVKLPGRMGNSEARLHKRSATEVEEKLAKTRKALESRLNQLAEKERPSEDPDVRMALGAFTPVTSRTAITVRNMTIRFGERVLLAGADARVPTGMRTALLGPNGCGKTTLVRRIVSGRDPRVTISPGVKIGYFGQDHAQALRMERTALENVMYDSVQPEAVVRTILARLQLRGDDVFKPVARLSGGERAKVALARLFAADVNALILDEATNHLDVFSLDALGELLARYEGTLLLISHDRRIVEQCAQRLLRFEGTSLTAFEGTLAEYERAQATDAGAEAIRLERTALRMRMVELTGKLSGSAAGKLTEARRAQLEEEYDAAARKLRALN